MDNKIIKKGKKPGDAMRTGAIIAIVAGSIAMIIGMLFSIGIFSLGGLVNHMNSDFDSKTGMDTGFNPGKFFYGFAIFTLVLSLLNIPNVVANTLLIKGRLNSSLLPGIFAIIGLGVGIIGIVCAVIIISGKFEDEVEQAQNEDFIHRNFNVPKWESANATESSASWRQATNNSDVKVNSEQENEQIKEMKDKINELEKKLEQNQEISK